MPSTVPCLHTRQYSRQTTLSSGTRLVSGPDGNPLVPLSHVHESIDELDIALSPTSVRGLAHGILQPQEALVVHMAELLSERLVLHDKPYHCFTEGNEWAGT